LEAICGLEYAAQAMAVHVGLLEQGKSAGSPWDTWEPVKI
jgi:predicted hotdog family 3-hydroxylacyl-ACP dehydratase